MEVLKSISSVLFFLVFSGIAIGVIAGIINGKRQRKTVEHSPIHKQPILTNHEKVMFGELQKALYGTNYYIFVQVSFGALLTTELTKTLWTFNQKRADYVICDSYFNVVAIIELDDKSHDTKQDADRKRDEMLKNAGYKVLRYRYMPPVDKLKNDIFS